ncbi:MAG: adenylosuccinate lyase [Verrucomicrobia bacterium]|jgi:adenylosuccinate lyase|nr:MAG: adenylosuccinate lyase [Verrucomicrobiota bacterium]
MIPNVLAERYATPSMTAIWSPEGKILLERELWIAVMKAQRALGLEIPEEAIADYERVKGEINVGRIMERERVTRHDVKARIDEFCELAGHEQIHKGMTSRDLTENVEQLQVYRSLQVILEKAVAVLAALSGRAVETRDLILTARTHNVAAQTTTFGKRLAMFGEELLGGLTVLEHLLATYPVRGIKGATGTQLDQLNLFEGDAEKVARLEEEMAKHLGLPASYRAVGQVYPRSLDFRVVSALCDAASGPSSLAKTLRLMAGHELASEGFAPGQTGSSAMPHKMNSRSCERINGLHAILKGHVTMAAGLAGDQWNEGDVSCSVVRRVVLPDSFFAMDGLLETTLVILGQMEVYPAVVGRETARYLPFLLTTTILMEAVRNGVGRETAHEAIKEHAVAAARDLRGGGVTENDLLDRVAGDGRLGLTRERLQELFEAGAARTGAAAEQVDAVAEAAEAWLRKVPAAREVRAGVIL